MTNRLKGQHSPARRREKLRAFLSASGGATVYEIADRLGVTVRTAIRYLRRLETDGEPLYEEFDGRKKIWRLKAGARDDTIQLSAAEMIALFLSRSAFSCFDGTGFKQDLDQVFARLEATLRSRDFAAAKNLDRKFYDINEAPHIYEDRVDDMNDIITALLNEDRIRIRHTSVSQAKKPFVVEPYTLLVYKKGLYVAGHSHHHNETRRFALDEIREVEWLKHDRFDYPVDFHPSQLVEGAFGMITGDPTHVRIFFDRKVSRYVRRRRWHPSQKIRNVPNGIELVMNVQGTAEMPSWIMSFGEHAEILEPPKLRDEVADKLEQAAARYRRRR